MMGRICVDVVEESSGKGIGVGVGVGVGVTVGSGVTVGDGVSMGVGLDNGSGAEVGVGAVVSVSAVGSAVEACVAEGVCCAGDGAMGEESSSHAVRTEAANSPIATRAVARRSRFIGLEHLLIRAPASGTLYPSGEQELFECPWMGQEWLIQLYDKEIFDAAL